MPNLATELAKELREAKLQGYPQELMPDLCDRVANLLEHLSDTVRITNGALDLVTKQRDEAERLSRERRAMLSATPQPPTDYDCAADCPCKG